MMMVFRHKDSLLEKYQGLELQYEDHRKYLIPGNVYEVTETPRMYDPHTFQPIKGYIVTTPDNKTFKVNIDLFMTIEEFRDIKLNKILNER